MEEWIKPFLALDRSTHVIRAHPSDLLTMQSRLDGGVTTARWHRFEVVATEGWAPTELQVRATGRVVSRAPEIPFEEDSVDDPTAG